MLNNLFSLGDKVNTMSQPSKSGVVFMLVGDAKDPLYFVVGKDFFGHYREKDLSRNALGFDGDGNKTVAV